MRRIIQSIIQCLPKFVGKRIFLRIFRCQGHILSIDLQTKSCQDQQAWLKRLSVYQYIMLLRNPVTLRWYIITLVGLQFTSTASLRRNQPGLYYGLTFPMHISVERLLFVDTLLVLCLQALDNQTAGFFSPTMSDWGQVRFSCLKLSKAQYCFCNHSQIVCDKQGAPLCETRLPQHSWCAKNFVDAVHRNPDFWLISFVSLTARKAWGITQLSEAKPVHTAQRGTAFARHYLARTIHSIHVSCARKNIQSPMRIHVFLWLRVPW